MAAHGYAAPLCRMLELPVASFRHDHAPAVCFDEADDITLPSRDQTSAMHLFALNLSRRVLLLRERAARQRHAMPTPFLLPRFKVYMASSTARKRTSR